MVIKAGISKNHVSLCSTYICNFTTDAGDRDLHSVKLLGHQKLKTTQVYAQVIDQKKVEAVKKIPDLNL